MLVFLVRSCLFIVAGAVAAAVAVAKPAATTFTSKSKMCNGAPRPWIPFRTGSFQTQAHKAWRMADTSLSHPQNADDTMTLYSSRVVPRTRGNSWGQWSPTPHCNAASRLAPQQQQQALSKIQTWLSDTYPQVDPKNAARQLVACLKSDETCLKQSSSQNDAYAIAALASSLPSMRRVRAGRHELVSSSNKITESKCVTLTRAGACSRANVRRGNPDTFPREGFTRVRLSDRPRLDVPRRILGGANGTCALVANGPLTRLRPNGDAIDAHGAVWRFNAVFEPRLERENVRKDIGTRTEARWFSRPRGAQAARCKTLFCQSRKKLRASSSPEAWMLWNYESMNDVAPLRRHFKDVVPRLLHPRASERVFNVYFQFRADLQTIHVAADSSDLPDMTCPKALSTGVHAVLTAVSTCGRRASSDQSSKGAYIPPVSLFGFSYSSAVLKTRSGHIRRYTSNAKKHVMYSGHGWEVDSSMLRVLTLAGLSNVCTSDDPLVSESELQRG